MSYFHCQILNGLAHVVSSFEDIVTPDLNVDFVTGDITPLTRYNSENILVTGAQGSVLALNAISPTTTLEVMDATGMAVEDNIFVELDDGTQYWSEIVNVNVNTITISRPIPSDATAGNQVAVDTQLDGTTDLDLVEDFKYPKLQEVLGNTDYLRTARLDYNNFDFRPTDELLGDVAAYLATGRNATEFEINSDTGLTYSFTDEDDLANFTYQFGAYVSNTLFSGQNTLLDALWDTDNTQIAVDLIVDNRTPTLPTLTANHFPFVRFTDNVRNAIDIIEDVTITAGTVNPPTVPGESELVLDTTSDSGSGPSLTLSPYSLGKNATLDSGTGGASNVTGGQVSLIASTGPVNISSLNATSSIDLFSVNTSRRIMRWRNNDEDVEARIYLTDTSFSGSLSANEPGSLVIRGGGPTNTIDIAIARDAGAMRWDSLIGTPACASIFRSTAAGADAKALTSTPTNYDGWNSNGPDFGNLTSDQANDEIVIDIVSDTVNGDLYEVDAHISFELTNGDSILFRIYYDDGVSDTATDIAIRQTSDANTGFFNAAISGQFRGPTSLTGTGAIKLYWSSPDAGTITFYETRLNAKRLR